MAKKNKSFDELMAEVRKSDVRIGVMSETAHKTEAWSTGNIALDSVTGIGGIPKGRIIDMVGKSMSGKTTASLQTAAEVQKLIKSGQETGYIMFLDFEQALDLDYCRALGLDVDHESFIYVAPLTLEEGANVYRKFLNEGHIRLCIVDSVAAMVSEKEAEADTGATTVADRAKALYQFCRQILAPLQQYQSSIIFLNHLLDVIPTTPFAARVKQTTNPGGNAIPYYASMRFEFRQVGKVKTNVYDPISDSQEEAVTSTEVTATVIKNKVSKPGRVASMRIRYGKGFSQPYSVYTVLKAHKVLSNRGVWIDAPEHLSLEGKTAFQGEEKLLLALESNPDMMERWYAEAKKCVDGYTIDTETLDNIDGLALDLERFTDKETGEVRVK